MKAKGLTKRTGGLLVAILLATIATTALISYVNGLENRAFAGAEMVHVYVAREDIPGGTPADAAVQSAAIARTQIPRKVVAEGAIASLDQIRGQVAAGAIVKGEQIVAARFAPAEQVGSGLPIPEGQQAMSIEVDTPPGVAGFVTAGARVSVLAKLSLPAAEAARVTGSRASGGDSAVVSTVRFLLQNVQVLAVGQSLAYTPENGDRDAARAAEPTQRQLLTLALTPEQAEKLGYAIFEGDVYFTLLPQGSKPAATPGRTNQNIFR